MVAFGIAALSVIMALAVVLGVAGTSGRSVAIRAAIVIAISMSLQLVLATTGVLNQWARRPAPIMPLFALCTAITILFAFSRYGSKLGALPLAALIGAQAFRFPLELVMHQAAMEGLMPMQMSYSGFNFDILTGLTAIPIALAAAYGKAPRWVVIAWNLMGTLLLVNIVSIAIASMPQFHAFGFDRLNTWVAHAPYVWLPGVLVQTALLGHLVLWRRIQASSR